ncbi:Clavaminate synthase-like protein [Gonapodya prolifera JEL478]|uniref:Clavaminate synthase-like protein n=1 Tax=Gonapodya prolifera (strain JEL478) TaxID=1344416 RepID=A0A139ANU3_GONPJ|nr:Clavaminate synthase-like protein [Gonapodya prolifera JEL478]|eukprot:KXS18419.1 Clavaminate synthase-like protein [Gonapodya prolifera JEL478]
MSATSIPVIDFSSFDADPNSRATRDIAEKVLHACRDVGFMYITGFTNPSPTLVDSVFDITHRLFDGSLSASDKIQYARAGKPTGYTDVGSEVLEPGTYDVKECYNIQKALLDPTHTPTEAELPAFLRDPETIGTLQEFARQCRALSIDVMRAMAVSLQMDVEWFVDRHDDACKDKGGDNLRLLHYPPVPEDVLESWKVGDGYDGKRAIRAGAHGDYGSLTLLFQRDESGLQVLDKHSPTERWIDAPVIPGAAVVNTGDLMEYWTRGLYKSTTHRVVIPTDSGSQRRPRYSVPYFSQPNDDVVLSPVPSPLVAASAAGGQFEGPTGTVKGDREDGEFTSFGYLMWRLTSTYK